MKQTEPAPRPTTDQAAAYDFSLLGVLRTLWQWRRPIIYTTLTAFVGTIVISLLLTTYYMAETRFLAINPDQANPDVIAGIITTKTPLYGNMNDIDRLMAIAESNELVDFLVNKYNLYEHYDIDTSNVKASTKVRMKFLGLYEVTKTPKDAILIEVEDKDPVLAANLANDARNQIDAISRRLIQNGISKTLEAMQKETMFKEKSMKSLSDSMQQLREKYNIFDLSTQLEIFASKSGKINQQLTSVEAKIAAYRDSKLTGRQDSIAKLTVNQMSLQQVKLEIDSQMVLISQGTEPLLGLIESRASVSKSLNTGRERLELFENVLNSDMTFVAVLEEAQPPVIKSRPKRSMIVIGATFLAFILSVLGVLALEHSKQFDWKKITD